MNPSSEALIRMGPIPLAFFVVALCSSYCGEAFIGMNWGRQSAQRLIPSQVADLMLQNGIRNVRIFTTQIDIMRAFQGTGVNLTITFFNNTMPPDQPYASKWIAWKQTYLRNSNVRSLIIGGIYVFDQGAPGIPPIDYSMNALYYVQNAVHEYGLGSQMSANFIHYAGVLTANFTKPSAAEFRPDIKDKMVQFLQFLRVNHAPFLVEMFPIIDIEHYGLDPAFAFADDASKVVIRDVNGAVYTNVFDWMYDCFVWALEKVNASDIRIVVTQVGWPTDGYVGANVANAERFYKYLLPMVSSNKGTPKRPGAPIDVFVNSLQDEPMISVANQPFMRHWGIYRSNGEPKYKIDLSGQGRDIYPTRVKGIMRMPKRWCVFNGNTSDVEKIERQVKRACARGDCTTLYPGASCSKLGFQKNVSYAFNSFFQSKFQDVTVCDYEGLGYVTDEDPSTPECLFPVEVVKGEQHIDFGGAEAHPRPFGFGALLVLSLCIFGGLL